jgi:integrase
VLLDENGAEVPVVSEFLHHMLADDARPSSLRSYACELLAWFRFLRAIGVVWDAAGRAEARDFALWLKTVTKPARPRRPDAPAPGTVNPLTGKATPGRNYAPRTRRHARAAIRSFYEYHREMHGRPLINPFPQAKGIDDGSLNAHHNPMQPFWQPPRRAAYQPKEPKPAPRSIPDQAFNELFAGLTSNRDRALIAFYISTGARAAELLGVVWGLLAPEDQTIGVVRKGSHALQHLPAPADAFVWLRLYQQEMLNLVPREPSQPVWWTLRRPFRPLAYDAARIVFTRVNQLLGACWTLLSRPGARFRCCHRPVSPDRSPNPPYRSLGNGLSTVAGVRRGSQVARGMGSCSPGRRNGRPSPFRSGRTRPRPPLSASARWRRSGGGGAVPSSSRGGPSACGRASRT